MPDEQSPEQFPGQSLAGRVVAITGASSGMGTATARHLAARGAAVVLGARRTDQLEQVAAEVARAGGDVVWARTDVTRREDVQRLVDLAMQRHGRLDVMVNNAGIGPISRFDDLRVEEWDAMIDVNLRGVLYGIAASLPVFRRQASGHVVNVASTAGLRITPTQGVYAATKTAVRVLSEALRQEAGPTLRVTVITPGFTDTAFAGDIADEQLRDRIAQQKQELAMPPDAVAHAIAYAIEQPPQVDVGEIVVRPTAQS